MTKEYEMMGFSTKAIHGGQEKNAAGALVTPIYQASTFVLSLIHISSLVRPKPVNRAFSLLERVEVSITAMDLALKPWAAASSSILLRSVPGGRGLGL